MNWKYWKYNKEIQWL